MYIEPNSVLSSLISENLELSQTAQFNPEDAYDMLESGDPATSYTIPYGIEWAAEANEKLEKNNNQILFYTKKYSGAFSKASKDGENYKFYDEREWRYVPCPSRLKTLKLPFSLSKKEFDDSLMKEKYHKTLMEKEKLTFTPNDIKYIIVKDDSEILKMVKSLKAIKKESGHFTDDEITLLTTRIITLEQIKKDF